MVQVQVTLKDREITLTPAEARQLLAELQEALTGGEVGTLPNVARTVPAGLTWPSTIGWWGVVPPSMPTDDQSPVTTTTGSTARRSANL